MIDLHAHILPGIDDGAEDMDAALQMARIAVEQGTTTMACTPHIVRGEYDNSAATILPAVHALQAALDASDIPLALVAGADVHIRPDLVSLLQSGEIPTLGSSRYFLFEPPHHVRPPNISGLVKAVLAAGFVPILTHPERLSWIERDYDTITKLDEMGVGIQVTAAALTGHFGAGVANWALRLLDEGRIDIVASDAHSPDHRPPGLRKAFDLIAARAGEALAERLTLENPQRILNDEELPEKTRSHEAGDAAPSRQGIKRWFFGS